VNTSRRAAIGGKIAVPKKFCHPDQAEGSRLQLLGPPFGVALDRKVALIDQFPIKSVVGFEKNERNLQQLGLLRNRAADLSIPADDEGGCRRF
jgi:hypothetical protein